MLAVEYKNCESIIHEPAVLSLEARRTLPLENLILHHGVVGRDAAVWLGLFQTMEVCRTLFSFLSSTLWSTQTNSSSLA